MQLNIEQGTTIADTRVFAFENMEFESKNTSGLHYHLVFHANRSLDSLKAGERKNFLAFFYGCARGLQGNIEAIGGTGNSVHLLIALSPMQTPADFTRKMKLFTAAWTKRNLNQPEFAWLDEEVSTVSQSQCRRVTSYIENRNFVF